MAYTYHELKEKTLQDLRAIAATVQHDAVKGASQMNKDHLLPALCTALGIDAHDATAVKAARRHLHHLNHQIRAHRAHVS